MSSEHRLHPASVLFALAGRAREFLIPGIVVLVTAGATGRPGQTLVMWLFLPFAVGAVVRQLTFRYRYDADELVIKSGVFVRNERHIPYSRIQNLDAIANVFHRWFGVVTVEIRTGSGRDADATLSVLPVEAFEEMRTLVFERRTAAGQADTVPSSSSSHAVPAGDVLVELPTREILLAGFIDNRGGVVVAAAIGLLWEVGLMERITGRLSQGQWWGTGVVRDTLRSLAQGTPPEMTRLALLAGALVAILVSMRVLSMALAFVKLHGFRLSKIGLTLRAEYGWLTRVVMTIPLHRVQTLTVSHGVWHRVFRRVAVAVSTAGAMPSGNQGDANEARAPIAPILPAHRSSALAATVGGIDIDALEWRAVDPRAVGRHFRWTLTLLLIGTAPLVAMLGWWHAALVAILTAWSAFLARRYVQSLGWATTEEAIAFRRGWWRRSLTIARLSRVQVTALHQTPFDRRTSMATLVVDTAGGGGRSVLRMPYMPQTVAADVHAWIAHHTATTNFRW